MSSLSVSIVQSCSASIPGIPSLTSIPCITSYKHHLNSAW